MIIAQPTSVCCNQKRYLELVLPFEHVGKYARILICAWGSTWLGLHPAASWYNNTIFFKWMKILRLNIKIPVALHFFNFASTRWISLLSLTCTSSVTKAYHRHFKRVNRMSGKQKHQYCFLNPGIYIVLTKFYLIIVMQRSCGGHWKHVSLDAFEKTWRFYVFTRHSELFQEKYTSICCSTDKQLWNDA